MDNVQKDRIVEQLQRRRDNGAFREGVEAIDVATVRMVPNAEPQEEVHGSGAEEDNPEG